MTPATPERLRERRREREARHYRRFMLDQEQAFREEIEALLKGEMLRVPAFDATAGGEP